MGCLLALSAAISPRFVLFLLYTTVLYALVYAPGRGVDSFGWFIVALGVLLDLSSHLLGSRARRGRARGAAET